MTDRAAPVRRLAASIRTRLLVTIVVVLAVGVGGTALVTRQVLLAQVDARIQGELEQEAGELRLFAAEGLDPGTGEGFRAVRPLLSTYLARTVPSRGEVLVTYVEGEPFQRTAQDVPYRVDTDPELTARWADVRVSERGTATTPAGPFDYLAVPVAGGEPAVFVVGVFRDVVAAEVEETVRIAAWVSVAVLLAGVLVAVGLARRILTPLGAVTDAARDLTDSDLSGRLEVVGHDEVAELAATFNGMLDRLERAFDRQRQFVDDAGHELRTPITVVRGHLELLDDDAEPGERADTVALVLDELDRMHRIVEELLTLAKVEQPDFLRFAPLDLDELTTTAHRKATALSGAHEWQLDAVGVGQVVADRQRLTQALVALADNAVKHTPAGTIIGIGSILDGDEVRLWVRDEGPGIDVEDRGRIFDRFARGSSGPRRSDGAGLGLAIVRAIAVAHGGDVELRSLPGQGSDFRLRLPTSPESTGDVDDDAGADMGEVDDTVSTGAVS